MSNRHFTYNETIDETKLRQGDVLRKSDALSSLLEKYHYYYADTKEYTHFQVLTQSCDLVRRGKNKQCTSRYITLAAVRNLDVVIKRIIEKVAEKRIEIEGDIYCNEKHKDALTLWVASLQWQWPALTCQSVGMDEWLELALDLTFGTSFSD